MQNSLDSFQAFCFRFQEEQPENEFISFAARRGTRLGFL